MIKLVLFDNNGTIFDDLDIAFGSVVRIFEAYGLQPPTKEQYRQEISADYMKFYNKYGFVDSVLAQEEKDLARALNKIREAHYLEHGDKACFRPDVAKTVFELKERDIRVGIVSAEKGTMLQRQLLRFGYRDVFNPVRADVHDKEAALREICRELNINPRFAIYVDDTVDGTSAARRAGLLSVGMIAENAYNSPERLLKVTPHVVKCLYHPVDLVDIHNNTWR